MSISLKYKQVLLIGVLLLPHLIHAQDFKVDISNVNKFYKESKSISMKMRYRVFADYTSSIAVEEYSGSYKSSGNYFFSEIMGIISVQDEKSQVAIHKDEKIIMLSKVDSIQKRSFSITQMDQLLKLYTKVVYAGEQSGNKVYTFTFDSKKSDCSSMKVFIENESWYVTKIILYYNDKNMYYAENKKHPNPRLEIIFTEVTANKNIPVSEFNTSRYVSLSNGTYSLASPYKNYRLINTKK
jgi:hypothetical protein